MIKSIVTYAIAAIVMGTVWSSGEAFAQSRGAKKAAPPAPKIGLIDMEEVFKNYDKFSALQDEFNADMQVSQAQLKKGYDRLQLMQKKAQDKSIKKGSPKFLELEVNFTKKKAEFEADVQNSKRSFDRRKAELFKTIYGEVQDMVDAYAKRFEYTLVMQFRRPKFDSADPQSVQQSLTSSVVYYNPNDDITDHVIKYLNKQYASTSNNKVLPVAGERPASKPRTGRTSKKPVRR